VTNAQEAEHHHLLVLVESAQRAGRSEREIVEIVERYFGEPTSRELGLPGRGLVRRLRAYRPRYRPTYW
jgi:hypothetical protein